jgi:hypothetical protein
MKNKCRIIVRDVRITGAMAVSKDIPVTGREGL